MGKKRIILPLLLSLCASTVTTAWASIPQDVTTTKEEGVVSGQVMDETGQPLPGVTIRIDGTNGGVASDYEGRFSIKVPKGKSIQHQRFVSVVLQLSLVIVNLYGLLMVLLSTTR